LKKLYFKMNRGNARYAPEEEYYYSDEEYDGCCVCISQNFIFWSNVLLLIVGLAGMGLSIYLWYADTLDWAGDDLALRFTMFSAFVILISMLGIQGTWDEVERCDLVVYLLLLVVIVVAQVAVVIYVAVNEGDFEDYLKGIWDDWSDARKLQAMESYECGVYHPNPPEVPGLGGSVMNDGTNNNNIDICGNSTSSDYCFDDCWEEAKSAFTTFGNLTTVLLIIFAIFELALLVCSWIVVCNSWQDDYYSDEESDRYRARL